MVNILIDHKYRVGDLIEKTLKFFSGLSSTTNEPNFKNMCNSFLESLNVPSLLKLSY